MDRFKEGNFEGCEVVDRKVHIVSNKNPELVMLELERFEKEHEVIDVKQPSPNLMFIFYFK